VSASLETTLEISALATGGDGVARADGLVVFTPRTAPGDRVVAEVAIEGRVGRGRLLRVESAGAVRVPPPCPHYVAPDRCGGCQLQHVALDAQREAKRVMVRDAFKRIGRRDVPLPDLIGGEAWRYRRALTLAIRRGADGRVRAGLRAYDDPEAVFDLADCLITDEHVVGAWREIVAAGPHLPPEPRLRGTVRWLDGQALFVLEGGREWDALQEFLGAVPALSAVWWQGEGKRRRLVADRRPSAAPGASFVQVNAQVAALVHADVVARAMGHEPRTVVDAYSGAGTTAALLAARGVRVVAIELDEDASAHAAERLPTGSRAIAARVEDMLPRVLPADVVLLNPPRAGVDARVIAALRAATPPPRAILYVSCDPATLARDVARLDGWRVHALTCYDMFPQTAHVETVCELRPEAA
jgi:23S rRNA (uracil1939-C5)-methyltransferase